MGFDPGMGGFWIMSLVSGVIGLAITIGIIALIILGIRWLIRQERPAPTGAARGDDPLEILRRRYANGEIDDEEYDRRRRTLAGPG